MKNKDELVYKKIIEYISEILNENNTTEENNYKEILNSLKDTEENEKSTNRVFLIFNADDISDKMYNVVGYIEDNNELRLSWNIDIKGFIKLSFCKQNFNSFIELYKFLKFFLSVL